MAFFGGIARKPTFGQVPGYLGGQGIGDGRIEQQQYDMQQDQGGAMGPNTGAMTKRPSFFGQGGVGRAIAGNMGDFLMQNAGMKPVYGPSVAQQRDMEHRAQIAEQQRMQGREDKQWEWQNKPKDPVNPQYFDDNAGNRYSFDPVTGEKKTIFIDPNDKQFIQDGQLITVPNVLRGKGQSVTEPPQAHIDALRTNPGKAADFDAKYGPGASSRYLQGGPVSQAPATFPRR